MKDVALVFFQLQLKGHFPAGMGKLADWIIHHSVSYLTCRDKHDICVVVKRWLCKTELPSLEEQDGSWCHQWLTQCQQQTRTFSQRRLDGVKADEWKLPEIVRWFASKMPRANANYWWWWYIMLKHSERIENCTKYRQVQLVHDTAACLPGETDRNSHPDSWWGQGVVGGGGTLAADSWAGQGRAQGGLSNKCLLARCC